MSDLALSFKIDAETAAAVKQVAAFTRQLQAASGLKAIPDPTKNVQAGVAATSKSLTGLVAQLAAVGAAALAVGSALKRGFSSNAEIESATLGITGIIASLQDVRDAAGKPAEGMERLEIAGVEAEKQLKLLRVAGMQTSAEFKDLAKAFQTAMGAGSSAGLSIDEINQLTVKLTLAAGAFNLAGDQLSSEIRAMFSGDQIDNSQIAQGLGITGKQIKLWREQGRLAEELNKRLEQFALLGDEAGKSWSATLSNVSDGITLFLGEATQGAFNGVKTALQDALGAVFDERGEIREGMRGLADFAERVFSGIGSLLADGINAAIGAAQDLSGWFERNREVVGEIFDATGRIVDVLKLAVEQIAEAGKGLGGSKTFAEGVRDALNGVAIVVAVIVDGVKGFGGAIAYVGGTIASLLLDPLVGVSRVLSGITGKDYTSGLEKVRAETDKFRAAAEKYSKNAFKFETAQKVAAEIERAYAARRSPFQADTSQRSNPGGKGGKVLAPPRKPSDDAKKDAERAARAYAEALRSYEDAKADADRRIAKVATDAADAALEASLKQRLITQKKYLEEKARLAAEENAADLAAARKREAAIQAQIAGESDPAKRLKLLGDLEKAKAEIAEIEAKGAQIPARLKLELADFQAQVDSLRVEIKAEILDAQGLPYEAALKRLEQKTKDLLNDPRVRGDADLEQSVRDADQAQRDKLKLEEAKRVIDDRAAYEQLAQQRISREVEAGKLTQAEAEKQLQAERDKTRAGLEAYIVTLEKLAAAYPDNRDFALSLAQAKDQVAALDTQTNSLATSINKTFADTATNALGEFLKGTQSVGDAVRGVFRSLFQDIANQMLKLFNQQLFKSLTASSGDGSMWGGIVKGIAGFFGGSFATGGHIVGPGTGTSDSILARLSNGEYVIKAAAVRKWGVGFLNSLNAGYMPRHMPAFASGGHVSVNAPAAGPTNVQASFAPTLVLPTKDIEDAFYGSSRFEREVIRVRMSNGSKF